MTAYLGTDQVRTFIVPASPPPDVAVAANFMRFTGEQQLDNRPGMVPFGNDNYPAAPRSSGETPVAEQVYTRGPNGALTNTLGGQPLPVMQQITRPMGDYTRAGTRTVGGPKTVLRSQNYAGAAETVFFADLQSTPPVPGDLVSIIAGLS